MGDLVGLCQYNQVLQDMLLLEEFLGSPLVDPNLFHSTGICAAP